MRRNYFFRSKIVYLFTNIDEVVLLIKTYDLWIILYPLLAGLGLTIYGVFSGTMVTRAIRNSTFLSMIIFVILWKGLVPIMGNHGLWLSFILYYFARTIFLLIPGFGSEDVLHYSKEIASKLNVGYMVKSGAKTGAYNSAAIRGIPSLLIESGGRGAWNQEEVYKYKNNIRTLLKSLNVYMDNESTEEERSQPKDITKAIYLESDISGFWYPAVDAGEIVKKGQFLGVIKDFFGEVINSYYAEINGVVLYMIVTLSVEKGEPLIAYGEI